MNKMNKSSEPIRFISSTDCDPDEETSLRRIADLMFQQRKQSYSTQKDIMAAYYRIYHEKITQGAVSKAINKLKNGFMYSNSDKTYRIIHTSDGYLCVDGKSLLEENCFQMKEDKLFLHKTVWSIAGTPPAYGFWINPGKMERAVEMMKDFLGCGNYLDIFCCHDNLLIVVLTEKSKINLEEFFYLSPNFQKPKK